MVVLAIAASWLVLVLGHAFEFWIMTRKFRVVRARLDCGCIVELPTGRYRVSKDLAAIIFGDAVRKGVWCRKHSRSEQVTETLGVFRES